MFSSLFLHVRPHVLSEVVVYEEHDKMRRINFGEVAYHRLWRDPASRWVA